MRPVAEPSTRVRYARVLGSAILAMIAVVVLPSEAWAASADPYDAVGVDAVNSSGAAVNSLGATLTTVGYTYGATASSSITFTTSWAAATNTGSANFRSFYRCVNDTAGSFRASTAGGWSTTTAAGGAVRSIVTTNACTSGLGGFDRAYIEFGISYAGTSTPTAYGNRMDIYPDGHPLVPASVCPSGVGFATSPVPVGTFSGAYVNGNAKYSLSFGWSGALPAGGWKLRYGSLSTGNQIGTVTTVYRTGTKLYGFDLRDALGTAVAVGTKVRIESAANAGCYTVVTLTSGGAIVDTGSLPTDTDGGSCGVADIACYLRAAFVPSSSTLAQWNGLASDAAQVIPFGYISGAISGLTVLTDSGCSAGLSCGDPIMDLEWTVPLPGVDDYQVAPFAEDSTVIAWFRSHRSMLEPFCWAGVLVPLVGFVWSRAVPFINSGS